MRKKILNYIKSIVDSEYVSMHPNTELSYIQRREKRYGFDVCMPAEKKKSFFEMNKKESLYLFRHFLKTIPELERGYLRKAYLKEEIKYVFRECSREEDIKSIMRMKNEAYIIIEKINCGVFPPFPQYRS